MAQEPISQDIRNKPAGAVIDDVMQQSQAALRSAARATAEMNELKRRADEALDWRKQLNRHGWLVLGLSVGISILVLALRRNR